MRIGQVAQLAGVTPKAIRRYEAMGLVAPERSGNNYREYSDADVRLIREIRTLSRLGIPVEETRPFLDCLATGSDHVDDCPAALAEYQRAIDEIDSRIAALTERRQALTTRLREAAYRNSRVATPPAELMTLPPDLPIPVDDGAAAHLPGMPMPPLRLRSTTGAMVDLGALPAGRTVVYLYPLTGRPDADIPTGWNEIPGARGCTPEACGFRDHHTELLAAGAAAVFGLSSQETAYQQEVVERLRLPFAMLSDPDRTLAAALTLPTFEAVGETLYKRLTLIVRDGVIEHVFYPVFPPDRHAHQVLEWLRRFPVTLP
ncbi:MerR family transcriptional regulator [Nocardia sp. CDC160]|uniref:MerR family transcriptional regulator n=1 Tax=Nocardia sp. CDC160 TaxID=3112166 RepID=UPI002DB8B8C4|nr:MerR family transcriptional regulator [Nocardia sp. CDC160]MEC3917565.1 MerR family transcriptional regulator [Nocardia sp. CDC160]